MPPALVKARECTSQGPGAQRRLEDESHPRLVYKRPARGAAASGQRPRGQRARSRKGCGAWRERGPQCVHGHTAPRAPEPASGDPTVGAVAFPQAPQASQHNGVAAARGRAAAGAAAAAAAAAARGRAAVGAVEPERAQAALHARLGAPLARVHQLRSGERSQQGRAAA